MMVTDKMSYRPNRPIGPILPILPITARVLFLIPVLWGGRRCGGGVCLAVRGALFHGSASLDRYCRTVKTLGLKDH